MCMLSRQRSEIKALLSSKVASKAAHVLTQA